MPLVHLVITAVFVIEVEAPYSRRAAGTSAPGPFPAYTASRQGGPHSPSQLKLVPPAPLPVSLPPRAPAAARARRALPSPLRGRELRPPWCAAARPVLWRRRTESANGSLP